MKLGIRTGASTAEIAGRVRGRLLPSQAPGLVAAVAVLAVGGCTLHAATPGKDSHAAPDGHPSLDECAVLAEDAVLDEVAQEAVRSTGFSGSALVVKKGKVLLNRGYGRVAGTTGEPITADTVFGLASLTKQVTAAVVLHLVDQGKLRLDDPVGKFFPQAPADKAGITLRQLLTHTSGLTDHAPDDFEVVSKEVALSRILDEKLEFTPGEKFGYSNSGFTLLALIVDKVTGVPYPQYVRETVIEPFQLTHTGLSSDHDHWKDSVVAHGFFAGKDMGLPPTWPGPSWGTMGNGELMTTTGDLARWFRVIRENKFLPEPLTRELFTPHVKVFDIDENGVVAYYGFGWGLKIGPKGTLITHGGAGEGGNTEFAYFVEQDVLIIVFSNQFWPDWWKGGTAGRIGPARPALRLREKLWAAMNPPMGGSQK